MLDYDAVMLMDEDLSLTNANFSKRIDYFGFRFMLDYDAVMLMEFTFAITGMVTAALISIIIWGSLILATPPSYLMSAGILSNAMTEIGRAHV